MGKRYTNTNYVKQELIWDYNDISKSNSLLEINQYNIKKHFDWLLMVVKQTHRNGRKIEKPYIPNYIMEVGEDKEVKHSMRNFITVDGSISPNKLLLPNEDEETQNNIRENHKKFLREEGNRKRWNDREKLLSKYQTSIDITIMDRLLHNFSKNVYDDTENYYGKWYVSYVRFRFRKKKWLGSLDGEINWKDVLDIYKQSFNCLWDLTETLLGICQRWDNNEFERNMMKYYKPIKEKYNIKLGGELERITKELGKDYTNYLYVKNSSVYRDESYGWNRNWDILFRDEMRK